MSNGDTAAGSLDRDLAQRLNEALTAGHDELFRVMQDQAPDVLRAALKNPLLGEPHLLSLLKRRDLGGDLLKQVCAMPSARESHSIRVALAHHPATQAPQLMEILPHLTLFELATVCAIPGGTPDQKIAAERAIIQRLPTTPLGSKITLAHRGTGAVVEHLLKEGDPRLMAACLDNPRLMERAVFQFLRNTTVTPEAISMVARHQRWQSRTNVKLAILSNPRTPLIWFAHWLPALRTLEVRNLYESQRLNQLQRREVVAELDRRNRGV